jgi:PKD repeat protein
VNSQGNLTLVWQQTVDNGPANIFAMLYDPISQTWSADRRLNEDPAMAHSTSAYFGTDGVIHAAYLSTEILRTTETITVDGQPRTITNIPQDGRTDLRLLDHSLIVDLAVGDSDLILAPQKPQEGDTVNATLDVHNAGDFAVSNFLVNLYVGNPDAGGLLVASNLVTDTVRAGDHRLIPFVFTFPGSSGNLVAVVDAGSNLGEFTKANNRAFVYLSNTAPQALAGATVTSGTFPLTVDFDASSSFDSEGDLMTFTWSFADGSNSGNGAKVTHTFTAPGTYPVTVAVTDSHGAIGTATVTITVAQPPHFQMFLEQSGPQSNSAVALDSVQFLRDPFSVINAANLLNNGSDRNTRVIIFVGNLQLAPGETSSAVVVNLIDGNNQSFDVPAEYVEQVAGFTFAQVIFRLPNNLSSGTCTIQLKVRGQVSNVGTIRIAN